MTFLGVISVLGQLALAAMAALVTATGLLIIASIPFPQLLSWVTN